jgi:hypothetical protein
MPGYEIKKENKEIYTAVKKADGGTIRYEFWQSENGWYLQCDQWSSGATMPLHSEIWVPQEIIDKIITADSAKRKLENE